MLDITTIMATLSPTLLTIASFLKRNLILGY